MFFYVFVVFYTHSLVLIYNITYHHPNILPFPYLYGMFCYVFVVFYTQLLVLIYNITYHQPNILPFPYLYGMFCHVFVVFYTQLLVLMLQYHISTTKHYTVPVFIRYVLLCACCILHTITCTNVTISHINNQKVYCSRAYTVSSFMCLLYFTHTYLH